ncbi:hypothetical protein G6F31_020155 [Rhizopus arrhizus]|nr:hypothetical protein G6F31_020155 [Rhizopus arrhizus]
MDSLYCSSETDLKTGPAPVCLGASSNSFSSRLGSSPFIGRSTQVRHPCGRQRCIKGKAVPGLARRSDCDGARGAIAATQHHTV